MTPLDSLHGAIFAFIGIAAAIFGVAWLLEQPWGWAYLVAGLITLSMVSILMGKQNGS